MHKSKIFLLNILMCIFTFYINANISFKNGCNQITKFLVFYNDYYDNEIDEEEIYYRLSLKKNGFVGLFESNIFNEENLIVSGRYKLNPFYQTRYLCTDVLKLKPENRIVINFSEQPRSDLFYKKICFIIEKGRVFFGPFFLSDFSLSDEYEFLICQKTVIFKHFYYDLNSNRKCFCGCSNCPSLLLNNSSFLLNN